MARDVRCPAGKINARVPDHLAEKAIRIHRNQRRFSDPPSAFASSALCPIPGRLDGVLFVLAWNGTPDHVDLPARVSFVFGMSSPTLTRQHET